jgi:hypothetical protein
LGENCSAFIDEEFFCSPALPERHLRAYSFLWLPVSSISQDIVENTATTVRPRFIYPSRQPSALYAWKQYRRTITLTQSTSKQQWPTITTGWSALPAGTLYSDGWKFRLDSSSFRVEMKIWLQCYILLPELRLSHASMFRYSKSWLHYRLRARRQGWFLATARIVLIITFSRMTLGTIYVSISFARGKATGTTHIHLAPRLKSFILHLHSPIHVLGVVLNLAWG